MVARERGLRQKIVYTIAFEAKHDLITMNWRENYAVEEDYTNLLSAACSKGHGTPPHKLVRECYTA